MESGVGMTCTCGGTAPGFPAHEWFCGLVERVDGCSCGDCYLDPACVEHGHLIEWEAAS